MTSPGAVLHPAALRRSVEARGQHWIAVLEQLVRCESPSGEAEPLRRCAELCRSWFEQELELTSAEVAGDPRSPWLRLRAGSGPGEPVLILGHLDTVWAEGSFDPLFAVSGDRAVGPGIFDMKGGAVVVLAGLAALAQSGKLGGRVTVLLTGDEETGSRDSRHLVESEAPQHAAVLVTEPPLGEALKISRKGVADYLLTVHGRAAHAGLDPDKGVNAVVELADLVGRVAGIARPELGTTVSPTVIRGGTRTNVIPDRAQLQVDVRFSSGAESDRVDSEIHSLATSAPGASLEVTGGPNRPPFEASSSARLFAIAREVATHLGRPSLEGVAVGGGSDGNFSAALGVPTLDGMGIVGGNAHAIGEWAQVSSLPERAALLAGCVAAVWAGALR